MVVTFENESETDRLLEKVQSGDRSALDALLAAHRAYLRRLVELRMDDQLRRRVDASDVVQEAQLAAARRIDGYLANRGVPFRLWLRQTTLERLINLRQHHVQVQKRSVTQEVHLPEQSSIMLAERLTDARPSRIARRRELAQQVRDAVAEMGERDREILLLRHFEELSNREISELLGIDLDTIRKRHGRAMLRFREKMIAKGVSGDS